MLVDGINLIEGSNATNLVVASGASFPISPDIGELFYKTSATAGLYTYDGAAWVAVGSGGAVAASALTGTTLASNVVSSSLTTVGTITTGTWSGLFGSVSGENLSTLNASNLSSGTVDALRLGASGTRDNTTFLRGDNVWAVPAGGGGSLFTASTSGIVPASGGGTTVFLRADGSWAAPTTTQAPELPYDVVMSIENKPTMNAIMLTFPVVRNFTIPGSFTGSYAYSGSTDPATSAAVFTVTKNGSSIGTITFAGGSTSGTFAGAGASFVAGDVLRILSPTIQDETLANIGITIKITIA